jgi:hypothetical protein
LGPWNEEKRTVAVFAKIADAKSVGIDPTTTYAFAKNKAGTKSMCRPCRARLPATELRQREKLVSPETKKTPRRYQSPEEIPPCPSYRSEDVRQYVYSYIVFDNEAKKWEFEQKFIMVVLPYRATVRAFIAIPAARITGSGFLWLSITFTA